MKTHTTAEAVAIALVGTFVGALLGIFVTNARVEYVAVKAGVGYYNPTNMSFEWRTNLVPVKLEK